VRFSIIIPAYNSEKFIRKALDSIKQQEFKDYELIVVCDSCEDATEEIAKEYGAITKNVHFHCDGPARSEGIEMATGDYILFMDDDDWWLHEYVLTQLDQKLKDLNNPDVLCFSFIFKHWMYASPRGNDGKRWIATWNKCWKRKFIGDTRFPNIQSKSDVYFHNTMMNKRGTWIDWDMPMYYYNYLRDGSQTEKGKRR
jgi:glycosyltransferase involved in cell wall biosynthesis